MAVRSRAAASHLDMDTLVTEVYAKYADELIRYSTALVGPSGAEDVFAAAFARLLSLSDWSAIREIRAYLYQAVLNEARAQHRATQRRLKRDSRDHSSAMAESASFVVRWEVLDAIRRLGVRQRAVVYLTYWGDLSVDEVADRLGVSVRTVARDLARGRVKLEELLS